MALKAFVTSLDDLPEGLRDYYTETDDGFILDLEDRDYKAKISEFRENNISLRKQADAAKEMEAELKKLRGTVERYKGIDPERAAEALEKIQSMEEQQLMDAGKLDEVVSQRTERMRQDLEGRIEAMERQVKEKDEFGQRFKSLYSDTVVENSLQRAITEVAAPRAGAMTDILSRGRTTWTIDEDGALVPRASDGNVRYGKDGQKPITPKEWAESLVMDAPYLFEGSAGGGSNGSKGDGTGASKRVSAFDQNALNANISDIASGKVEVISNQ